MVTTASSCMLLRNKLPRYKKIDQLVVKDLNIPVDSSKLVDAIKEINVNFLMRRDLAKLQ
jgi:hypothetical protein